MADYPRVFPTKPEDCVDINPADVYVTAHERENGEVLVRLVYGDGGLVMNGKLFAFTTDGCIALYKEINPEAAKLAGITINEQGSLIVA